MEYPETKRQIVIDELHSKKIEDPYRWLENFDDEDVQEWLENQHQYTQYIQSQIPNRDNALKRITELLSMGELTPPKQANSRLFYEKRKEENQPILYVEEKGKIKELINPNKFGEKNPVALDWYHISPECNYLAYGLSENGDEWSILQIIEVETGKILSEKIPRTRACSLAWRKDESGFYYTRFPESGTVPEGQEYYNQHIFYHKIGTNWRDDPKIFGEGQDPTNHYSVSLSKNEKYLIIHTLKYTKNDLQLMDLENGNKITDIIVDDDSLSWITSLENTLWILSNRNHPRYAIYKAPLDKSSVDNWELVIPESENIIREMLVTNDAILIKVMKKASEYILRYDLNGQFQKEIDLPDHSSIYGLTPYTVSAKDIPVIYFGLRSFIYPANIYKYDIIKDEIILHENIASPILPENYIVKQVWYESKDKTKVSMFLAYKKEIKLNGKNPTLLCGYGGFNIPLVPPYLKYSRFYWLERGGILAIANLRGGSEYGEEWHRGGMLEKKQNVFDDFIAAAEWLIDQKYTSKENLSIFGRSNGGLLTGAAITQRPDLFNAVYIGVPLLDMIRYHKFSIAKYWIPEYGSAENPEQFPFIYKYSPYHNVRKGTSFPATFLVAAASDSRVDPNHAMKMTALMQWANTSKEPIILFIESKAGHGIGKPLDKLAKTETDFLTFVGWKTGLNL
ncbi:MAG: prolyl oligopeptidase family protein [Candidatus Thorarchaeota archaeon]